MNLNQVAIVGLVVGIHQHDANQFHDNEHDPAHENDEMNRQADPTLAEEEDDDCQNTARPSIRDANDHDSVEQDFDAPEDDKQDIHDRISGAACEIEGPVVRENRGDWDDNQVKERDEDHDVGGIGSATRCTQKEERAHKVEQKDNNIDTPENERIDGTSLLERRNQIAQRVADDWIARWEIGLIREFRSV